MKRFTLTIHTLRVSAPQSISDELASKLHDELEELVEQSVEDIRAKMSAAHPDVELGYTRDQ